MDFTGKVTAVMQPRSGVSKAGKPWKSQEFVLQEEKDQYPQSIVLEVLGEERIEKFALKVGDVVSAKFNSTCRQYNGKFYNSLQAWAVNKEGVSNYQPQQYAGVSQQPTQQAQHQAAPKADINDLPF